MISAGIDSGLYSTKVVLLKDYVILAQVVIVAGMEPSEETSRKAMCQAAIEAGISVSEIGYVVATGGGKMYLGVAQGEVAPDFECLAQGMKTLIPSVQTVLDVGAQKSLAVKVVDGKVVNMAKNDKCASGAGTFLQMVADVLSISVDKIGEMSLQSIEVVEVSSTCAVFAETEIISLVHASKKPEDILGGVCRGLARRFYPLLLEVKFQPEVAMVGGVSLNVGVHRALEKQIGCQMVVLENPLTVSALGAATIASEKLRGA